MHKVFAAVVLAGAMLVACSHSGAGDSTRIGPDAAPGDGRHGRRDAGPPGDGPLASDGGPLPPDDGALPSDGSIPLDGPRHRDARLP